MQFLFDCRPNTFQVVGCDESSKVTLYCDERKRGQLEEWLAAIRRRTAQLRTEEVYNTDNHRHYSTLIYDTTHADHLSGDTVRIIMLLRDLVP